jgi:hypothetical protein
MRLSTILSLKPGWSCLGTEFACFGAVDSEYLNTSRLLGHFSDAGNPARDFVAFATLDGVLKSAGIRNGSVPLTSFRVVVRSFLPSKFEMNGGMFELSGEV